MTHKSSFFESLLRLNPSSFYVAAGGAVIFIAGYYAADLYSWVSKQNSFAQKILGSIVLVASPGLVKMVDLRISADKENAVKDAIDEQEKLSEKKIKAYEDSIKEDIEAQKGKFRNHVNELRRILKEEELPRELKQHISQEIDELKEITELFFKDLQHSRKISSWLDVTVNGKPYGNRYPLIHAALASAKVNSDITEKFEKNIKNCIRWLKVSLENGNPCRLDRYQASALFDGELSADPYILALNTIGDLLINEPNLNHNSRNSTIVNYMIQNLIEKIENVVV